MVGDLEEIDNRQAAGQEPRIDLLLDVAGQEESMPVDVAEEHDRYVVDGRPTVGRPLRHRASIRPQHLESNFVDGQPVAGGEGPATNAAREQLGIERRVPGPRSDHAGLEDASHGIAAQQRRQSGGVILVRVRQDHEVDAAVPGRKMLVEGDEEPPRVGPAVDEKPTASTPFDEDRVALPDVEDGDPGNAVRSVDDHDRETGHGYHQPAGQPPPRPGSPPRTDLWITWPRRSSGCRGPAARR